jgi:hypothetical protein
LIRQTQRAQEDTEGVGVYIQEEAQKLQKPLRGGIEPLINTPTTTLTVLILRLTIKYKELTLTSGKIELPKMHRLNAGTRLATSALKLIPVVLGHQFCDNALNLLRMRMAQDMLTILKTTRRTLGEFLNNLISSSALATGTNASLEP